MSSQRNTRNGLACGRGREHAVLFVTLLSGLEVLAVGSLSHIQMREGLRSILVHGSELATDVQHIV